MALANTAKEITPNTASAASSMKPVETVLWLAIFILTAALLPAQLLMLSLVAWGAAFVCFKGGF